MDDDDFAQKVEGWLPRLDVIPLPAINAQMLFDFVHWKKSWKELKTLALPLFDGLAAILTKVEEDGAWPDGLLDAYIAMTPKSDGDAALGQRPLFSPCCLEARGICSLSTSW